MELKRGELKEVNGCEVCMEEVLVLIERSHSGDKEARKVLIEKNLGLVHHIVRRFVGRGVEMEDLFQIGSIGLMKAIDKFDLSFEVKFSTYAVPMITGEIKRFLRDDGLVKVSRSMKEKGLKIKIARQQLCVRLGREPTLNEIALETDLSLEDIVDAMEAGVEVESLYSSVFQSDGSELFLVDQVVQGETHSVGTSRFSNQDLEKEQIINHMLLEQLLNGLNKEEREIIRLRYFFEKTQIEVAKLLGISQVQVSRLEKKILLSLRKRVG